MGGISLKQIWGLIKNTFQAWNEDEPFRQSAIIAYYSIFALPGLLLIVVTIAGAFFGEEAVKGEISNQVGSMIGNQTAKDVEKLLANTQESGSTTIATIIGIATLIFGATGVFFQLQQSLNEMWGVKARAEKQFAKLIKDRVSSFGMILVIGFLLLISLLLSAGVTALSKWMTSMLPDYLVIVFRILDFLLSFGIVTLLFAMIYKVLPDVEIRWTDVWIGAIVTSFLFVLGKTALSLYFTYSDPASTYGAAGSFILILLWVSYSSLILFFGAEFTYIYAIKYGSGIRPSKHAVMIKEVKASPERKKEILKESEEKEKEKEKENS